MRQKVGQEMLHAGSLGVELCLISSTVPYTWHLKLLSPCLLLSLRDFPKEQKEGRAAPRSVCTACWKTAHLRPVLVSQLTLGGRVSARGWPCPFILFIGICLWYIIIAAILGNWSHTYCILIIYICHLSPPFPAIPNPIPIFPKSISLVPINSVSDYVFNYSYFGFPLEEKPCDTSPSMTWS